MATASRNLSLRHRRSQARRAANIAALVALWYQKKVVLEDPDSLERWFEIMLPRILAEHEKSALEGAKYANALRALDVDTNTPFTFEPVISLNRDQAATSLRVVGPVAYRKHVAKIDSLDIGPTVKRAMLAEAKKVTARSVAGSVVRHVQNGARRTVEEGVAKDPVAFGYVRVTRDKPCYFCAMLASRGLEGGIYQADSFDMSDPRFVGAGTAKVHDHCQCHMAPVYRRDDETLLANKRFEDLWYEMSGGEADMLTNFRRNYTKRFGT